MIIIFVKATTDASFTNQNVAISLLLLTLNFIFSYTIFIKYFYYITPKKINIWCLEFDGFLKFDGPCDLSQFSNFEQNKLKEKTYDINHVKFYTLIFPPYSQLIKQKSGKSSKLKDPSFNPTAINLFFSLKLQLVISLAKLLSLKIRSFLTKS